MSTQKDKSETDRFLGESATTNHLKIQDFEIAKNSATTSHLQPSKPTQQGSGGQKNTKDD
jgi:hypothetical protein